MWVPHRWHKQRLEVDLSLFRLSWLVPRLKTVFILWTSLEEVLTNHLALLVWEKIVLLKLQLQPLISLLSQTISPCWTMRTMSFVKCIEEKWWLQSISMITLSMDATSASLSEDFPDLSSSSPKQREPRERLMSTTTSWWKTWITSNSLSQMHSSRRSRTMSVHTLVSSTSRCEKLKEK